MENEIVRNCQPHISSFVGWSNKEGRNRLVNFTLISCLDHFQLTAGSPNSRKPFEGRGRRRKGKGGVRRELLLFLLPLPPSLSLPSSSLSTCPPAFTCLSAKVPETNPG